MASHTGHPKIESGFFHPMQPRRRLMASSKSRESRPLAVVTGASSGIGYELARQFAQHGFDLLICAEDTGITEAAKTVADGGLVESLQVDLANHDGVEKLYAKIQSLGRPVEAI